MKIDSKDKQLTARFTNSSVEGCDAKGLVRRLLLLLYLYQSIYRHFLPISNDYTFNRLHPRGFSFFCQVVA